MPHMRYESAGNIDSCVAMATGPLGFLGDVVLAVVICSPPIKWLGSFHRALLLCVQTPGLFVVSGFTLSLPAWHCMLTHTHKSSVIQDCCLNKWDDEMCVCVCVRECVFVRTHTDRERHTHKHTKFNHSALWEFSVGMLLHVPALPWRDMP